MKLISHRGNLNGPNTEMENNPKYVEEAILRGYDVEIDVRVKDGKLYLGHDEPQYPLDIDWLEINRLIIWIHCRDIEIMSKFIEIDPRGNEAHFFWHDNNKISLTNKGYMWCSPGEIVPGGIVYQPIETDNIDGFYGVCSDNIENYR